MHQAVESMRKLGELNTSKLDDFIRLERALPDNLTLQEAAALFGLFGLEDDDDHCGLVWDLLARFEAVDGMADLLANRNQLPYWLRVLKVSLDKRTPPEL